MNDGATIQKRKFTREQLSERKVEYPVFSSAIAHKRESPVDPQILASISPHYDPNQLDAEPSRVTEWAYFLREYRLLCGDRKAKMKKHGIKSVAALVLYEVGGFTVPEISKVLRNSPAGVRFLIGYSRGRKWTRKRTIEDHIDDET